MKLFSNYDKNKSAITLLSVLLVSSSSLFAKRHEGLEAKIKEIQREVCEIKRCVCNCTFIRQKDFSDRKDCKRKGLTLSKPGRYCFAENIKFAPEDINQSAITITCSGVILDFGRYTLSQVNTTEQTYGVFVERDVERIVITGEQKLARIFNFTLDGIRVLGRTRYITIENLIVTQAEPRPLPHPRPVDRNEWQIVSGIAIGEGDSRGIDMQNTNPENIVQNVCIRNVVCSKAASGLVMVKVFGLLVEDSVFCENTYGGAFFGARGIIVGDGVELNEPYAADGIVRRCHFDRNVRPPHPSGNTTSQFGGAEYNRVYNFIEEYNTHNDNIAMQPESEPGRFDGDYVIACDHDAARNVTVRFCEAHRNVSRGLYADGIHFSGGIGNNRADQGIVIDTCHANDNVGVLFADGFQFAWVQGGRIKNCEAHRNGAPGGFFATGFAFFGTPRNAGDPFDVRTKNIEVVDCLASRSFGSEQNAGFFVDAGCERVAFRRCTASGSREGTLNAAGILVAPICGRETDISENIVIDDCIVIGNGADNSFAPGGVVIMDLSSDGFPPLARIVVQNTTAQGNIGSGFLALGPNPGVVIKCSEADTNFGNGFTIDSDTPENILVAKNLAFDNAGDNYSGVSKCNIVAGTTARLPRLKGSKPLHNFSITTTRLPRLKGSKPLHDFSITTNGAPLNARAEASGPHLSPEQIAHIKKLAKLYMEAMSKE